LNWKQDKKRETHLGQNVCCWLGFLDANSKILGKKYFLKKSICVSVSFFVEKKKKFQKNVYKKKITKNNKKLIKIDI
jgi:hypothetical protein